MSDTSHHTRAPWIVDDLFNKHNIRLALAAPELLQAVEDCYEEVLKIYHGGDRTEHILECISMCEDALEKAKPLGCSSLRLSTIEEWTEEGEE